MDRSGIDSILVGDSYKMVVDGEHSTIPATMVFHIPVLLFEHFGDFECRRRSFIIQSRLLVELPTRTSEIPFSHLNRSDASRARFVVADMPFGSYEVSTVSAVDNAVKLMKFGLVR